MNPYAYLEQRMRISLLYHWMTHAATWILVQNLAASQTCFALIVFSFTWVTPTVSSYYHAPHLPFSRAH